MALTRRIYQIGVSWCAFIGMTGCIQEKSDSLSKYIHRDTTVTVYGPYVALKLPITKGVKLGNPIQLALGPGGLIYAANQTGEIYTLHDSDGDGLEDSTALYCDVKDNNLRSPVGFAHRGDTVYIGTAQQVRVFLDTSHDHKADTSWTFFDQVPQSEHPYEWISGLSFGPDGWLYIAITTDSWNAGPAPDPNALRGAIIKISPGGKRYERVATGIRSVPGMAFNTDGDLFFVDNEGGGNPTEELNRLVANSFYGHNKRKYPADSAKVQGPEFELQSEIAPSSIEFNQQTNDFGGAGGNLFVSYYGPGERWTRGAVGRVVMDRKADGGFSYREYTVADVAKLSDLAFGKDGNLYLASHGKTDYWYNAALPEQGAFYKLVYDPAVNIPGDYNRTRETTDFSENAIQLGKQVFAEASCLGCHEVDGVTELLGPNLKDIAKNYSRAEILEEIENPSARIKPSMGGVKITKKDGNILLGRVVNADAERLTLILVGNRKVTVLRRDINILENEEKSLMYEGLLSHMPFDQQEALLDYMMSLSNASQ
jgi:putative heme-binding domain-containing protein